MCPNSSGVPTDGISSRRRATFALLLLPLLGPALPVGAAEPQADSSAARDLVSRADLIRFPAEGFQVDVAITTTEPDTAPDERAYRIVSKGNDRTLVQITAPAVDRNQILLMRDHDLWAFLPNLSQPVRLPLSQRLTGEVANGDLARANFSGDYVPSIVREDSIEGETYQVLQLDATEQWVTYRRVMYWVSAKTAHPYKAEFYAVSGRLLKTCYYQDFKPMAGVSRPSRLVIEDGLRAGRRSVLVYDKMVLRDLPDKVFTKDYLKMLSR